MVRFHDSQRAFTLVETVLAAGILAILFVTTASVLLIGHRSSQVMALTTDQSQELRIAMKQIADDMQYAQWDSWPTNDGQEIIIGAYVAKPSKTGAGWAALSKWPGDLTNYSLLKIRYVLEGDKLIREVYGSNLSTLYSRQVVASHLLPYAASGEDRSYLKKDPSSSNTLQVELRTEQQGAGGSHLAEVYSEFVLR